MQGVFTMSQKKKSKPIDKAKLAEKAKKKNRIETRWINKFMNLTQPKIP